MDAIGYRPEIFDSDDDTLGIDLTGVVGSLGQAGLQQFFGWLGGRGKDGANCLQGQVSGDASMSACIPFVMAKFDELEQMATLGLLPPTDIIIGANQIASIFSDSKYFNQTIGGRSRELREAAKVEARQRADLIIEFAASLAATQQQQAAPTTTPTTTPTTEPTAAGQIDTKTILMIGGAAIFLMLLLKN